MNCVWLYIFGVFTVNGVEESHTDQIYMKGTSQQEWQNNKHKVHIGETDNKDWSCTIRQHLKYRYSKQSLLDIANMVKSHSKYK